jgi:glycosyltransferase involved in cell wall biosynthesis
MARILAVTNLFPPHYLGGYETTCRDVTERLVRRGHRVEVLTSSFRLPDVTSPNDEETVHRTLRLTSHFPPLPRLWQRPAAERANVAVLRSFLDKFQPDVVSVWNMMGISLSLVSELARLGLPLVFVLADDWLMNGVEGDAWMRPLSRHPIARRIAGPLFGVPTEVPDLDPRWRFCFASHSLLARYERSATTDYPNAEVTPLGVDLDDFPLEIGRDASKWAGRLLFVGRIHRAKGVSTLLEATRLLPPEITLDLIGRGDAPYVEEVRGEMAQPLLEGRVELAAAPRSDLRRIYLNADVCVFPSEWEEPFGIVPLEAMACGTPVIATGAGGSGEYLRDGENCLLFPPGDAASLAAAVTRLSREPRLRSELVSNGYRTASSLTVDRLADRLGALHVAAANIGTSTENPPT